MAKVTYRIQGNVVRLQCDDVRLALGGYWYSAAEWKVTQRQLDQLQRENPAVEFVAQTHKATVEPCEIGGSSD